MKRSDQAAPCGAKKSVATATRPAKKQKAPATAPNSNGIATPQAIASAAPTLPRAAVYADHNRRTALQLDRTETDVEFIRLDVENGFAIECVSHQVFDREFNLMADYPADRCARLYVSYALLAGATEEAMKRLGLLTPTTEEDVEMATKKKAARAAAPGPKAAAKGKPTAKKSASSPATETKAPTDKPVKDPQAKQVRHRGETAANMFKELIREGKLTDEQIFLKVQAKFNLDDNKKHYVKWYRNHMRKNGEKVPDAKRATG